MSKQYYILFGIILLSAILLITDISALADSDATFQIQQYQPFLLTEPCIYNGTICSPAAICNITVNYLQGNGSILYNNTLMNLQGGSASLQLTAKDNFLNGWYQAFVTCFDQGASSSDTFYYYVSPSGNDASQASAPTIFIVIGLVATAIIIGGYLIRSEYITFIGGMAMLVLSIYSFVYGFGGGGTNQFTYMLSTILCGLGIIFTIAPAYTLVTNSGDEGYEIIEETTE